MSVLTYVFNKRPSITYAITVCNEHKELKTFNFQDQAQR